MLHIVGRQRRVGIDDEIHGQIISIGKQTVETRWFIVRSIVLNEMRMPVTVDVSEE